MKEQTRIIEYLECRHATGEFGEEWSIDIDLIEESYIQFVELRGIDSDADREIFQIFASHFEPEICKSREDRACGRR